MALTGKLVDKIDIACPYNLFYETYICRPNYCSVMAPDKVKTCNLVSGQWGVPGSVISWLFIVDGKINTAKEIVQAVDDETHKVVFNVIEGEVLEVYSTFIITLHVEVIGGKQSVVWTVDYEKVNASIPDPTTFLDLLRACAKDLDAYILKHA